MQLFFDFPVNPDYSLSSFVPCSGNRVALDFAKKIILTDGEDNLLYIYGDSGSGKSHLLHALSNEFTAADKSPSVLFICCEQLTREAVEVITASRTSASLLLLDNLQALPDHQEVRVALWQLFNDFYESGRKIVAAATLPPKELDSLDEHLKSRFMWGVVARLDISDDGSRRMIMKKLADDRQLILPDDVIDYLLIRLPRDIPSLAEAVKLLVRHSFATKKKISLKMTREIFS